MISINVLGPLQVVVEGETLTLPASKKTRSLLGYLTVRNAPQRRERLCELFWDMPDDPRGSLRWSLSKLRRIINQGGIVRLIADRERVQLDLEDVEVDIQKLRDADKNFSACIDELEAAWKLAHQELLEDCDLPQQEHFSFWLSQQREQQRQLRVRFARRLTLATDMPTDRAVAWADRWLEEAPFDPDAAIACVAMRRALGRQEEASLRLKEIEQYYHEGEREPPQWDEETGDTVERQGRHVGQPVATQAVPPRQKVQFVKASDGANLAWASVGEADRPPLVKAANWLSHLELDWEAPIWSPLFHDLSQDHRLIRYDERGCGLSDWEVPEISMETFVSDLELVTNAAGLERFPLLGISQGAGVCVEYAVRHPERVSHLILFGGYPSGWRLTATEEEAKEREAVMVLTKSGWGSSNPAYRHLFSRTFMPDATLEELEWFDEFQRLTTSPENAVKFLEAFSNIDVRPLLSSLQVPTLVIHSHGDLRIPISTGREMAAAIPNAAFMSIESNNHLLIGREPAAAEFVAAVRAFLKP